MIRIGPFQIVYTEREQKLRDTLSYMLKKYGLVRTKELILRELAGVSMINDSTDYRVRWWQDLWRELKSFQHSLAYGAKIQWR